MTVQSTLHALAECLCAQIATDDSPAMCFCGVVPGDAAVADYAGDCDTETGMAWVRLISTYPATGVGVPDERAGNCGAALGFDVEVGILRMMSVGDDLGNPPTAAEQLAAVDQQVKDMMTMRRAVACCPALPGKDFTLNTYTPQGPYGALVGGFWTISVVL